MKMKDVFEQKIGQVLGALPYELNNRLITVTGDITGTQLGKLKELGYSVKVNGSITSGFTMSQGKITPK